MRNRATASADAPAVADASQVLGVGGGRARTLRKTVTTTDGFRCRYR